MYAIHYCTWNGRLRWTFVQYRRNCSSCYSYIVWCPWRNYIPGLFNISAIFFSASLFNSRFRYSKDVVSYRHGFCSYRAIKLKITSSVQSPAILLLNVYAADQSQCSNSGKLANKNRTCSNLANEKSWPTSMTHDKHLLANSVGQQMLANFCWSCVMGN